MIIFGDTLESWWVDNAYKLLRPFFVPDVAPFAAKDDEVVA